MLPAHDLGDQHPLMRATHTYRLRVLRSSTIDSVDSISRFLDCLAHRSITALALSLVLIGCGGGSAKDIEATGDAGPSDAGVASCRLYVSLSPETQVGATVTATAVEDAVSLAGARFYQWEVLADSGQVVSFLQGPSDSSIAFELAASGVYTVRLSGSIAASPCSPGESSLTAVSPGANAAIYRLQIQPPAGSSLISTNTTVVVAGGGNASLGERLLVNADVVTGTITDSGGTPASAYLRAVSASGDVRECFAGGDGTFSLPLADQSYRLEVHPSEPGHAPLVVQDFGPSYQGALQLPEGESIVGMLRDSLGQPITGATVSVKGQSQLASLAETAIDGSFELRGEFVNGLELQVRPPTGSGLPVLLHADVSSSLDGAWQIQYLAFSHRNLDASVTSNSGAPLGLRQAYLRSETIDAAGAVLIGATSFPLGGEHLVRAATSADGRLTAELGPSAYTLMVSGTPAQRLLIPAGNALPPTLTALAPATARVLIEDQAGPVPGASVLAWSESAAGLWIPSVAIADSEGVASVAVTPHVDFELKTTATTTISSKRAHHSALEPGVVSDLGSIVSSPTQLVLGRVVQAGGAMVAGAHVALFCQSCSTSQDQPLARAVTGDTGRFELRPADPGVSE